MADIINAYNFSVRKLEGKTPSGRIRHTLVGNLNMNVTDNEIRLQLIQDKVQWWALVLSSMNFRVP
jgi:hypothetical protein